jgi:hypothetical protein
MLIALGTEAAMKGYRVRYTLATKLVNELVEAADEKQLNKTIARYGRVDLLCIDELGYMELDRHGAELLFQVLTEREEKNSVAIASNESFGGWTKTFTDPRLCAAIVDRLPSTAPSSRPAPTPTASPAPEPELKHLPRQAESAGADHADEGERCIERPLGEVGEPAMAAVSIDAALVDGLLHVAAQAQSVICLLEVTEDRCRGEHGLHAEACLFCETRETASDGRVADHFCSGVTGERAARLKILSVDDQGVPVGFRKADACARSSCTMELRKGPYGVGNMHEDSVDLGSIHRARLDRESVHVPFMDLHPAQIVRAFASPSKHVRVTVDADHSAPVPDTFRQRRQVCARAASHVQHGLPRLEIQQVQQLLLVRTAGIAGGSPQHVGSLIRPRHSKSC